ncbi:MAG TPA: MmcQ/YjbR family DNA-binding protein [Myxococcota bacterium]|nr:MmcQ/YjbR family DNA-binding protein [Myxococcota bacterium]
MAEDRRLAKLTKLCLALPEATLERNGDFASFRVRKKVFAYFLDNHHGDGIVSLCWKAELGENQELAQADPKRFYVPAYIGPRGWAALRLDRGPVDWDEVAELAMASYCAVAPKTLVARLTAK